MKISGWGRYPRIECRTLTPRSSKELSDLVIHEPSLIARGNGRAYGDAALNKKATVLTESLSRILDFDDQSGLLTCEAGLLLSDLIDVFLPRGWFPTVTPGSKLVSVGGAIASDVHGKNHHGAGSFSRHVDSFTLITGDGRHLECSRLDNADLFHATCGGMGLTGIIDRVRFRLQRVETGWIKQKTISCKNLEETMRAFAENSHATYSVAWIDCLAKGDSLGRSLLYLGEHASLGELAEKHRSDPWVVNRRSKKQVPIDFPSFALNGLSVRAFNEAYFRSSKEGCTLIDWDSYFYPLDSILDWNRIYGANGFTQYQCVLPTDSSEVGLRHLLTTMSEAGIGSFLSVLKLFGEGDDGLMSFPMPGYTLAMDFPMGAPTLSLLDELDAIVEEHGGRLYLAKDARMGAQMLRQGYPNFEKFQAIRRRFGGNTVRFSSVLSSRLAI